jgi:hypothetical protein
VVVLAMKAGKPYPGTITAPMRTELAFVDLSSALHHVGSLIEEAARNHEPVVIDNLALDMGLTIPWAIGNFLSRTNTEDVTYRGLVIDADADHIKEFIGDKGTIQRESVKNSLHILDGFAQHEQNNLRRRKVTIAIQAYSVAPIIHGFLLNHRYLFLGFTEVKNGVVDVAKVPYVCIERSGENNSGLFNVYESWFRYLWSKSRPAFLFNEDDLRLTY